VTVALVAVGIVVPAVTVGLPLSLLRRYGVVLLAVAALVNGVWLMLYAFGEDDYTGNGQSRWQTHSSTQSHLYVPVALIIWVVVVATAAAVRTRWNLLRLVALCAALGAPLLWFGSALAFDNN
jgi:hypothetical protein